MTENRVAAVDRALSLLGCFDAEHDRLTLKQLAERTGLYKSTILRLAGSLEASGYLNRLDDGSFSLGPTLWRLGSIYRKRFNFAETIRPVLRKLAETTHESASFYIREQGAAGHLIRAYTDGSGEQAADIMKTGYAISLGERDPDTASVAVPVFGADRNFLGAVVVSGLRTRFDETARGTAIKAALAAASELGPKLIQP